jgi:hypothetical protein
MVSYRGFFLYNDWLIVLRIRQISFSKIKKLAEMLEKTLKDKGDIFDVKPELSNELPPRF